MHFEVKRSISASPETVWPILTNRQRLIDGGFGILRLEGEIRPGSKIKLWSEASPGRAFSLRVSSFTAPSLMVWESGMPFGLFKGVRRFVIEGAGNGCNFHMREDYTGPLAGMIGKSIPDLTPSFEKFADALKSHAEGTKNG
jgi:hypothetical protein